MFSTNSHFRVRRMSAPLADELQEAAAMLASAFDETPLFRLAFPDPASRAGILRALFVTVVEDAVRHGRVDIAYNSKIVGMLVWYPPGGYPMSALRILRFLPQYARITAANPLGILKLFRVQTTLNRIRPKEPHCHGYFLGGRQGGCIAAVLINQALREIDENGWPTYLETQERRSARLYARFGFKMLHEGVEALPGGPLNWTMWREPRANGRRALDCS
jgi:hypothetical protein